MDFRCDVGTPIVAVFSGTVVEVRNSSNESGARVPNLFAWNSILLKKDGEEIYVEYVHISKEGLCVMAGDAVTSGQRICSSGDVGFCPEPHLHMQVHRSDSSVVRDAPSVPITFQGQPFVANERYP